jgi:hypothetical protein
MPASEELGPLPQMTGFGRPETMGVTDLERALLAAEGHAERSALIATGAPRAGRRAPAGATTGESEGTRVTEPLLEGARNVSPDWRRHIGDKPFRGSLSRSIRKQSGHCRSSPSWGRGCWVRCGHSTVLGSRVGTSSGHQSRGSKLSTIFIAFSFVVLLGITRIEDRFRITSRASALINHWDFVRETSSGNYRHV